MRELIFIRHQIITFLKSVKAVRTMKYVYPEKFISVFRGYSYRVNMKTVAASLRRQALRAKASRKLSPVSYRAHGLPVSENLLKQDFYTSGPNQKWSGDITYLRTHEGWLYLAVVIDLWSRAVSAGQYHRG